MYCMCRLTDDISYYRFLQQECLKKLSGSLIESPAQRKVVLEELNQVMYVLGKLFNMKEMARRMQISCDVHSSVGPSKPAGEQTHPS